MCQFLQFQSHCKNLELPHCQWPDNIENCNKVHNHRVNKHVGKFGLKRRNKPLFFSNLKMNSCNVLRAYMCIEVSYYHSPKSISCSKNVMNSTVALRMFKKLRFTTESDELISSECCWKENLQLKVAALPQKPKKMVELSTLSKTKC